MREIGGAKYRKTWKRDGRRRFRYRRNERLGAKIGVDKTCLSKRVLVAAICMSFAGIYMSFACHEPWNRSSTGSLYR